MSITTPSLIERIPVNIPNIAYTYGLSLLRPIHNQIEDIPADFPSIRYAYSVSFRSIPGRSGVIHFSNDNCIYNGAINDVVESMFDSLPIYYSGSEVLKNIYNVIRPELAELYLLTSAYDISETNPDDKIDNEIRLILNSAKEGINIPHIGYGHEKILYQNYIVSANRFLVDYARFFGINFEDSGLNDL